MGCLGTDYGDRGENRATDHNYGILKILLFVYESQNLISFQVALEERSLCHFRTSSGELRLGAPVRLYGLPPCQESSTWGSGGVTPGRGGVRGLGSGLELRDRACGVQG